MQIYTLYVGQGNFNVIVGDNEAIIVDSYVPLTLDPPAINIKGALSKILNGKLLKGVMMTGFDADHFNPIGLKIILNKYRPEWIMYPRYYKETKNANECFKIIKSFETQKEFKKISVGLSDNDLRFYLKLSDDFTFEVFSPHLDDMTSSNNCSLVCKVKERKTGLSCLVTGDTENMRWENILEIFKEKVKSHVLFAPHHGSIGAMSDELMMFVEPHTVVVSAGVGNQFDHPHDETLDVISEYTSEYFCTNQEDCGVSILTSVNQNEIATYRFTL